MTKRKHVSFTDNEMRLLDHALQHQDSFPEYIKRLIEYDMQYNVFSKPTPKKPSIYDIYNRRKMT
jgi:hypothetical protein